MAAAARRAVGLFNVVPLHDCPNARHPATEFDEVKAATLALRTVGNLRQPPNVEWKDGMDLLDWLGAFFGFQKDNVRNQREHLVLLLANGQMRLKPEPNDTLAHEVVTQIRRKITKNYTEWCKFVNRKSNIRNLGGKRLDVASLDERLELLYTSLYLLVWGEAANLRFMPECLAFIFHHMAGELNRIIEHNIDETTSQPALPAYCEPNGFLNNVVAPLYKIIQAESLSSNNGTAPHSAWRNYDDLNEYFWDKRCFTQLGWPLKRQSNFLVEPPKGKFMTTQRVGKTGFVEQRSFWNIYRSFDRVWILFILVFQASILLCWNGGAAPWIELKNKDSLARVLSIFITWGGLRILQTLLDAGMESSLVTMETRLVGIRMTLKFLLATAWTMTFAILYGQMWKQRHAAQGWSAAADRKLNNFLYAAAAFIFPEVLALLLIVVPWFQNFLDTSNWKIFHLLTWWFQSRLYVGRGLREGLYDNLRYTAFWVVILGSKFAFSYILQIKPMIEPTKELLKFPDSDIIYAWHEFFRHGNRIAVACMWAPVVLIYFMDIQIWYSVYSSLVGALVGLLQHLGEIRNYQQLKLRFQYFAKALQYVLIADEEAMQYSWFSKTWTKVKEGAKRFSLRYGLAEDLYSKINKDTIEANKFEHIWNEIIHIFREEDLVSDSEVALLEVPIPLVKEEKGEKGKSRNQTHKTWEISVMQWPLILIANEILIALGQAKDYRGGSDKTLWQRICKSEYRRCAVIEVYESVKHMMRAIIIHEKEEHRIIVTLIAEIDASLKTGTFTKKFQLSELPEIHARVVTLVSNLMQFQKTESEDDSKKVIDAVQYLYDGLVRDFPLGTWEQLGEGTLYPLRNEDNPLFVDAVELPGKDDGFYRQVRRLHTTLSTKESLLNVPRSLEARRRITFFSNSLFMTMPRAPTVEKMLAFSVLTPYYDETVLFSKEQLQQENEDGVSTLFYLQKIYPDEWRHFLERMEKLNVSEPEIWDKAKGLQDLRLWASYRGQTLARTVRGMMYYDRALQLQAFIDKAEQHDIDRVRNLLYKTSSGMASHLHGSTSFLMREGVSPHGLHSSSEFYSQKAKQKHQATAAMKFTYVVTCQIYGIQKAKKEVVAEDIQYLMREFPPLRIAYVDETSPGSKENQYFSVLAKYDAAAGREVDIYRIQLPGPVKIGEGKPENQNHAIIFTRGDAVQAIDMNQDNYFEEALKMRNLLQEFTVYYGLRKPTILGVREHVFTGSVSSLAWFMSAQESSFVTLGQRVLATPLKVRMHYGHPDVFDRLWFLTRGGISKASRVINISEDIYAGFNCTLRGGNVTHHEYIQAGKGRDVGLNQIALFEAKVASGNGEQVLSRDVYRLGHRLDFFRMLSFYYTTVGFFINNMIVVLTVYAFLWGRVYLALSGVEASIIGSNNDPKSTINSDALAVSFNQQFVVQIGLFTALPMLVENSLEHGFTRAVWEMITMQLQLASIFFTFSMGTRAHFFGRTILHGGAKYRATGRGFVVKHEKFAENYRLYSRSHFVKGLELVLLLVVYQVYGTVSKSTASYLLMTFSAWFLAITWIMAPFIFNPSGFDWLKTVDDVEDFTNWIFFRGGILVKANQSWETWWEEEYQHLHTAGLWAKLLEIILNFRFLFFQYGIVYRLKIAAGSTSIIVYLLSWIYVLVAGVLQKFLSSARDKYAAKTHRTYRSIQAAVIAGVVAVFILMVKFTHFVFMDLIVSLMAFIPTGWALIQIAQVLKHPYLEGSPLWSTVVAVARLYEFGMGMLVLIPVAFLSWLPGFQAMQTRILFNEAFSRGLQISRILVGKKPNAAYT